MTNESQRSLEIPLTVLGSGGRAIVASLHGGHNFNRRLAAMGIYPGTEITLIRSNGPLMVEVRGVRYIIGRGVAHRVMVSAMT